MFNYSVIISFFYFLSYAFAFIIFFYLTNAYSKFSTNLHQIVALLKYNKSYFYFFICNLLTFLGIPPFFLFSSKFAGLTITWEFSNFIFFFVTLLVVFFSFALYLQLFDLLFMSTTKFNDNALVLKQILVENQSNFFNNYNYNIYFILTSLSVISIFGFLLFKDLFFCLSIFI